MSQRGNSYHFWSSKRHVIILIVTLLTFNILSGITNTGFACGWHYETIKAEAKSLPCTKNVALNAFASYPDDLLTQKIKAALFTLMIFPESKKALDELAVSAILLQQLPLAKCALDRRSTLAPDEYATLANLGTYYTFSGELDQAEKMVQIIVDRNPKAHFGREVDHLTLIRYLKSNITDQNHQDKDRKSTYAKDMYGREFKKIFKRVYPFKPEAKDVLKQQELALISMISIYGAKNHPLLYATLAVTLKQQGNTLLAAAALREAIKYKHPQRRLFKRWIKKVERVYRKRFIKKQMKKLGYRNGEFADLNTSIKRAERKATYRVRQYHRWLTKRFKAGLQFWTRAGLEEIYEEQIKKKLRCTVSTHASKDQQFPSYPLDDAFFQTHRTQLNEYLKKMTQEAETTRCSTLRNTIKDWSKTSTDTVIPSLKKTQVDLEDRTPINQLIELGLRCSTTRFIPPSLNCNESIDLFFNQVDN